MQDAAHEVAAPKTPSATLAERFWTFHADEPPKMTKTPAKHVIWKQNTVGVLKRGYLGTLDMETTAQRSARDVRGRRRVTCAMHEKLTQDTKKFLKLRGGEPPPKVSETLEFPHFLLACGQKNQKCTHVTQKFSKFQELFLRIDWA